MSARLQMALGHENIVKTVELARRQAATHHSTLQKNVK